MLQSSSHAEISAARSASGSASSTAEGGAPDARERPRVPGHLVDHALDGEDGVHAGRNGAQTVDRPKGLDEHDRTGPGSRLLVHAEAMAEGSPSPAAVPMTTRSGRSSGENGQRILPPVAETDFIAGDPERRDQLVAIVARREDDHRLRA